MGALLSGFASWLLSVLLYVPQKIFELALDGIAAAFNAIPAPGFLTSMSGAFAALGNDVLWWLGFIAADFGIPTCLGALTLRFLLRRIPVIG